jgi:hypothetical protein
MPIVPCSYVTFVDKRVISFVRISYYWLQVLGRPYYEDISQDQQYDTCLV